MTIRFFKHFIKLNLIAILYFSTAHAFSHLKFVQPKPELKEELAAYPPGKPQSPSIEKDVVMPPMRSFAQFGGVINSNSKNKVASPFCGPSPRTNTMNCFDFTHHGLYLGSFPIPGRVSSTPIYFENSWLIGTSKGFLMRVEADKNNRNLPKLGGESVDLWGSRSREVMANLKPKPVYLEDSNVSSQTIPVIIPQGVKWVFPASSSFIGTPVVKNGLVYVCSASQYLQAFNWDTGKLMWAVRLAPSTNLRLDSEALIVTESFVVVGNSLGTLLVLNPINGSLLWSWQVSSANDEQRTQTSLPAGPDKFSGIVAQPLLVDNMIIVSNAESMTQSLGLETHHLIWSYPVGSVAKTQPYKDSVLLGTSHGKVVSLNKANGRVNWKTTLTDSSPVISLFLTQNDVLLAATRTGQVFMLEPTTGQILAHNFPIGEVNGEFFPGFEKAQACLNFAANGVRCFRAKL